MFHPAYVVGLVDGEGSFYVHINDHNRRRAKIELKFSVKLRAQDKCILDQLKEFFGCGNVYVQRDARPNHSTCYRYEVQKRADIQERIIPFFMQHQLRFPSKQRDFALFCTIVELSTHKQLDMFQIRKLKQCMHHGLAVYGKTVRTVGTLSNSEHE